MIFFDSLALERVREIKHLSPDLQVSTLIEISNHLLHTASAIRASLASLGGVIIAVTISGSDQEVVLSALLAILSQDIATLPDAQLRAKSMMLHDEVIRQVGILQQDAEFFRRYVNAFEHALAG